MKTTIGIDIGGTAAKMGVVSESGEVLQRKEVPIQHDQAAEILIENIDLKIDHLVRWSGTKNLPLMGLGVSVCGYLDQAGERLDYINIHALDNFPLKDHLEHKHGIPAILDNDMNCGALGEYYFGAGKGVDRLMVMTIGFGIGMGVIVDGDVVRTNSGTTGNPGHIIVEPDGPYCTSGCRGCLEAVASSDPISRMAENLARSQRKTLLADKLAARGSLTPEDLFHAAEEGDEPAQRIWEQVGTWLGRGLIGWVEIFGPQVVLVGGGVANAGHWLLDPIEREMRKAGEPYFMRGVREIKPAMLGRDATMLGAASLFLNPDTAPSYNYG
ncbi:MAG: ROK family protein [Anaerolineales bacterium]|nr:ROK family protein [Anaerolineales bacterium]